MSRNKLELILGILVFAMPFLGFPPQWKTLFLVLIGSIFIIVALVAHIRRKSSLKNIYNE